MEHRKSPISEADVWKACDEILLAKERPTIERVRQVLGRGSPNTVTVHLNSWFAELGSRIVDPQGFIKSAALPDPVTQAATYLWEAAQALARKEAQEQLTEQHKKIELKEQELDELLVNLEQDLQMASVKMQSAIDAKLESDAREAATAKISQDLSSQLMQTNKQLQESEQRNQALLQSLENLREASDQQEKLLITRFDAAERRMALELDAARQESKSLRLENIALKQEQEQKQTNWIAEKERLTQTNRELQFTVSSLTDRIKQLDNQVELNKERPTTSLSYRIKPSRSLNRKQR